MVDTFLTKEMIEAGARLIRKLDERGIQPEAVFWLYSSELQKWKLVIAEIKVGKKGPKEVYQKIQQVLATSSEEIGELSLDDIVLVKPDAPIVALLRMTMRTGSDIRGIRFKSNVINGTLVEDAYIYRLI